MASPPQPQVDVDLGKLSYEIFSFLESKFLYGGGASGGGVCSLPGTPGRGPVGGGGARVRVLAIDGCGPGPGDALLAAAALARLEAALRAKAGDPDARVADFFDAAAGAGAGGVLAAMLFVRGVDGRPKYTAADALAFVAASLGKGGWGGGGGGWRERWAALFRRGERSSDKSSLSASSSSSSLRRVFGDATLRDTVAPLLVPCYDLATGAPFLFSRADAVESDSFDFRLRDVCAATCAGGSAATAVRSVNGLTAIAAASGGVAAMGNPAAAAITHILHNKQEFPLAAGVDDLLVVSIGSGSSSGGTASGSATPSAGWRTPIPPRSPSPAEMVRLTAEGVADMVDQAVAMAFGHTCGRNYVRIQAAAPAHSIKALRSLEARKVVAIADGMLTQRNVEAELFRGRRLSEKSNREKLDAFATELVKEHDRRRDSPPGLLPNVAIKQVSPTPPRLSSATTSSAATTGTTGRTASTMPSPASTQDSGH
ncbi:patatin-like protein 3 [Triticum dicoccoides]|uniref:patatin-like protein 3 n=1 Tax=Triticum dicoccoides TaxID=85692 RepID=UPI0018905D71|nr:patatin-like protein 3 [Triticum dicoccoides]